MRTFILGIIMSGPYAIRGSVVFFIIGIAIGIAIGMNL